MRVSAGDWCYCLDHDEPSRVIAVDVVWGGETAQVWLARRDAVVRLHGSCLQPLAGAVAPTLDQLCYVASAARILDAMERDALIAPLEGSIIPGAWRRPPRKPKALSSSVPVRLGWDPWTPEQVRRSQFSPQKQTRVEKSRAATG